MLVRFIVREPGGSGFRKRPSYVRYAVCADAAGMDTEIGAPFEREAVSYDLAGLIRATRHLGY